MRLLLAEEDGHERATQRIRTITPSETRETRERPRVVNALERIFARERPARRSGESSRNDRYNDETFRQRNEHQLVPRESSELRRGVSTRRSEGRSGSNHRERDNITSHPRQLTTVGDDQTLMPVRTPRGNGHRHRR